VAVGLGVAAALCCGCVRLRQLGRVAGSRGVVSGRWRGKERVRGGGFEKVAIARLGDSLRQLGEGIRG
jgi:hypothetical protein